jgi:choline dehydrogenase-like flavoprotein
VASYLFPFRTNPGRVFHKQVCLTDHYEDLRKELGTATGVIQDVYTPAPVLLRSEARRGLKTGAGLLGSFVQCLLCVAEDEPQADNRVWLSDEIDDHDMPLVAVHHRYSAADHRRSDHLLKRAAAIMRRAGGLVPYVHRIDSLSHALGTLRAGTSCETSVLDPECRFWGIDNLTVSDGSFMPTAGGVNPSLTIAANALRVAERLVGRMRPAASGQVQASRGTP